MESVAAFRQVRRTDLGADQGPVQLAHAAEAGARGGDPGHRRAFSLGLRTLRPCLVAEARGLPDEKIATIVAGQRPVDLSREESVAYDVASSLVRGGTLPELLYQQSVLAFGEDGCAELINLVGLYCLVSVILNGFDVPVPDPA